MLAGRRRAYSPINYSERIATIRKQATLVSTIEQQDKSIAELERIISHAIQMPKGSCCDVQPYLRKAQEQINLNPREVK